MSWLKEQVGEEWYNTLAPILKGKEFSSDFNQINQELQSKVCYPSKENIFKAFELCKIEDLKCVLIGQDPYHDGCATGLCFDTDGQKLTPSLRKINEEYDRQFPNDFNTNIMDGKLSHWAVQGMLMINTALTVEKGKANSHAKLWEKFTDKLLDYLSKRDNPILFICWGKQAQNLVSNYIKDDTHHSIIKAEHPAAAIYTGKAWNSNDSFLKIKEFYDEKYNKEFSF